MWKAFAIYFLKFLNFEKFTRGPSVIHNTMRKKQVEFDPLTHAGKYFHERCNPLHFLRTFTYFGDNLFYFRKISETQLLKTSAI